MIRNLLASTAIAALLATGALAQTTTTPPAETAPSTTTPAPEAAPAAPEAAAPAVAADGQLASNMIGETVYNGTGDDAENIGDVNDIVIDGSGMAKSIVIGVGGFLGIGEKNVAVDFKEISWAEKDGDRWIVVAATVEQLEALPDFDRTPYDPAPAVASTEPAPSTDTSAATPPADDAQTDTMAAAPADKPADTAAAPADTTTAPAATPDPATTAAIDKTKLTELPAAEIRAENLIGTTVYGADDSNIGEIGDVVLTTDQKVDAIVLDVGGFLGVGEKEVAVGMDKLVFMTDADGKRYLYTTFTKEQLDAAPAYDESTWAEKRDEQRLMLQ
jgi:sporulation protein YlmC with PRC-barrel domain